MGALEGLNSEQSAAVKAVDGHLLVVAGAGSGKTRVLTHKIAYLIEACGISPYEILAMTFSNKAAREMKDRVRQLLSSEGQPQWVGTFHSSCLRILREFCRDAGLPERFSIYDESDQLSAIKRALKELKYDPKKLPPKVIRYHINRAKNETTDVVKYLDENHVLTKQALDVAKRYEEILNENKALDFGALLTRTVLLLRDRPEIAAYLRERWPRILIDEYQDTNRIQKELIQSLAGDSGIVCAVGDEDQSIYRWRGARVENILEFETDFPHATILKLEQNYRSTRQILTAANHVISRNVGRRGKELWTQNDEGSLVTFYQADDDYGEAAFVVDRIKELTRTEGLSLFGISIFYRTHVQSRVIEEECRRRNLPYRVLGGIRFYDRAEIKNMLAFLLLALNPHDNVSFTRIVNTPARGIGAKTLDRLANLAASHDGSMLNTIPYLPQSAKADKALHAFHAWFHPFTEKAATMTAAEAAEVVIEKSGYVDALELEGTIEAEARVENIEELLRSMQEFWEEDEGLLPAYLDRISLVSDTDKYDPNAEILTLMTVHNSKGLEFDAVFVVGVEEGIFPHARSIEDGDPEEIEEERRLCYVAMTRARKYLTLSAAYRRRLYHSTQFNPISRFLEEIPAQHLLHLSSETDKKASKVGRGGRQDSSRNRTGTQFDEFRQESYDDDFGTFGGAFPYHPGARVVHPDFGLGTIRKCEGKPENAKLTIKFQRSGTKKLMLNYCSLELVEQ